MATKLYRCLNEDCAGEGEGEVPVFDFADHDGVCPKCGAGVKTHPRTVVARETIHYLVNDDAGKIKTPHGRRAVACDPAAARMPKHATALAAAVTCPACQASAVYQDHVAGNVDQSRRIVTKGVPPVVAGGTFNIGEKAE